MDCSLPGSSVHGILQDRILEWVSHSLLQRIFPTQGLNPGLPHCRWILYHLSHQGSPKSESESCSAVTDCLWPHGLYSLWNSPGPNTGVGSLSLFQGIFPTQGSQCRSPALQVDCWPAESPGKFIYYCYCWVKFLFAMSAFRMSHTSFNSTGLRNSLAVQWLGLRAFTARAEFNPWLGN